jgi:hypothetical protein
MELEQKKSCKVAHSEGLVASWVVEVCPQKRDKEIKTRNEGELTFCPPMMVKGVLH